jgi:hypothetical protein
MYIFKIHVKIPTRSKGRIKEIIIYILSIRLTVIIFIIYLAIGEVTTGFGIRGREIIDRNVWPFLSVI